jgi:thiamine-phosphate pyrophosphorylase
MASLQQQAGGPGKTPARTGRRALLAAARATPPTWARSDAWLPPAIFMTDPQRTPEPARVADRLPAGWGVIYRHFGMAERFAVGDKLARICRRRGLVLMVSADVELALEIGAEGVHWPQARLANRSRPHPGSRKLIETASVHSRRALIAAARSGIDAAIVSTVFPSRSATATAPMGILRFRALARSAPLPVYALGGVDAQTAGRVVSGAHANVAGWAAVGAIADAWG